MNIDRRNLGQLCEWLKSVGYVYVGHGRHRIVFKRPRSKFVLKLPLNDNGVSDNWHEAVRGSVAHLNPDRRIARCRTVAGCLLLMEHVQEADLALADLPGWVGYVDCWQVGLTASGRLVAYDFGLL